MRFILPPRLRTLGRDQRGFVLVWVALMMSVLVGFVAMAADVSMAFYLRNRLAVALDSAGLAMGAAPWGTSQDQLKAIGQQYMNENFGNDPQTGRPVAFKAVFSPDLTTISLSASMTMPTSFARVLGVSAYPISTVSEVKRDMGLEVSMILDNTGSMWSNNNIQAVRDSATNLVNILFGDVAVHPKLKIGLVPYSVAVNVSPIASQVVSPMTVPLDTAKANTAKWKGCVIERAPPYDMKDSPTAVGGYWTQYWWPSSVDNNWSDTDIDTNTAKLDNKVHSPNIGCPTPIQPLTNVKQTLLDAVGKMTAWNRGGTMSNVGMAWGLRMLSPEPPLTEAADWGDATWRKAAILMTDGDNLMFDLTGDAAPNKPDTTTGSDWSAYGRIDSAFAQSVFGTKNLNTVKDMLNTKLAAVCQDMKDKKITVYTIIFTSGITEATKQIYKTCASDTNKYFYAPTQADLKAAFNTIGLDLNNLRVSR